MTAVDPGRTGAGISGWLSHVGDARGLPTVPKALATTGVGRSPDGHRRSWRHVSDLNHLFLAGFSRNVFPLPLPDDTVVTFMMIFALMAIGLNIVIGFAGLLDLGYVAFYALGAYTAAFLASPHFGSVSVVFLANVAPGFPGIHLPFWIVVPVAIAVAATFGALLGAPTLRLRGDYLAIVTLGFGEIVPVFFRNMADITFNFHARTDLDRVRAREPDRRSARINPIDAPFLPFFRILFNASAGFAPVTLGCSCS